MRNHPILTRALPLLLLMLAGCDGGRTAPPAAPGAIFPLAVGNRWIGRMMEFQYGMPPRVLYYDTTAVIGRQTLGGTIWYQFDRRTSLDDGRSSGRDKWLEWRAMIGDILMKGYAMTGEPPAGTSRLLRYPARPGDTLHEERITWADSLNNPILSLLRVATVRTIDRRVSVPAGMFPCCQYDIHDITTPRNPGDSVVLDEQFYAPGVGPVRMDGFSTDGTVRRMSYRWELMEYRLEGR